MPAADRRVLRLTRVVQAPQGAVYRALTAADVLARWWGPRGFSTPALEFAPQVGGSFWIAMQPPEGALFHLRGEFRQVQPPTRLAYSFSWDPPAPDDRETEVVLELEEHAGATELRLTQGDFATEERRALHETGWSESLDRLAALLVERPR